MKEYFNGGAVVMHPTLSHDVWLSSFGDAISSVHSFEEIQPTFPLIVLAALGHHYLYLFLH